MTRRARKIETGDITPAEAAELMRLSPAAFTHCLPPCSIGGSRPQTPQQAITRSTPSGCGARRGTRDCFRPLQC